MFGKKYTEEEIENHCKNWESSGLKQSEYCKHVGLSKSTFYYWAKRYKKKQLKLLPVVVKEASSDAPKLIAHSGEKAKTFEAEIRLPDGMCIRFLNCADPNPVIQVFKGVRLCS